ncbi:L-galactose dehydrogenase-like isoform X2 [Mizuhopecten yessoensis]|uniref:L-galactose dehydrogenase n=1 Tax=Mizuhopecten yessoensis TaxID=6573 RepID=A0A210QSM1_MIZYE|nr:L-galactose dehydrogenase-like isoform X2 [Mizuhopecten yessoensis]OWF51720.1 L-galactose dehydrogenase [Mizuhopecten yessoensis]
MSDIAHDKGLPATFLKDFHNEESVRQMTYNRLGRTDMVVSALSYGASALGSVFRNTDDTEGLKVVEYVIKNGVNYIDVAPWYGHGKAEQVLGRALQTIPRSSYFISTKVGRYLPEIDKMFDFGAERTIRSVDESLARLGLEKVDLVQVHDIEFADNIDIIINETLPALQKVKDSGKARYIGITGYPLNILKEVLERSSIQVDTVLSYCRACMHDNSLLDFLPFFQKNGTGVINASPVSMGLLTERGAPDWHPASDDVKRSCAEAAVYCRQMGTDLSRVALSYSLDLPLPTTLFSSASLINAKKNLDAIFMPLTDTERKTKEEIMKRYMRPLKNENWEGVEEDEYWAVMRGDKTTATKLG